MNTDLEGRITLRLHRDPAGGIHAQIRSSRPQLAPRLLAGQTPERAVELAGLIFTLCGRAQRLAALLATRAARGHDHDAPETLEQNRQVLAEIALEHAWQLLVNWPQQHGQPADLAHLLPLRQAGNAPSRLADLLEDALRQSILGSATSAWLAGDWNAFQHWCAAGATPTAAWFGALLQATPRDRGISRSALLPALADLTDADADALARQALDQPDWCTRPTWLGQPAETGAVARLRHDPLLTAWLHAHGRGSAARLLARLLELARLPAQLRAHGAAPARAWRIAPGLGLAGVETARGLLLHVVRVERERVVDYRIVAPTEWNFHPAGALADGLSSLASEPDPDQAARRIAHALDACVAIEVEDA